MHASDIAVVGATLNVFSYDAVWVGHRTIEVESEHRGRFRKSINTAEHQILGLLRPSIEPINFPCRADALHAIPQIFFLSMLSPLFN